MKQPRDPALPAYPRHERRQLRVHPLERRLPARVENADQVDDRVAIGERAGEVRGEMAAPLDQLQPRKHEQVARALPPGGP